jgi:hypothetical protein
VSRQWHKLAFERCLAMQRKWEAFTFQWKKIFDYKCSILSGHISYLAMSCKKGRKKEFPLNFSSKLYDIMMLWYLDKEKVNPKDCRLFNSLQVNN